MPYLKPYNRDKRVQCLSRGVCGGGVKGIRLLSMGRGPGESVVHGPRTSSLRHWLLPSIGIRLFLPMFKARFEVFWTPFKIFSSVQSVGNFLNFNICFNVWVVFRLLFAVRAFKQHPPSFSSIFEPQNAIFNHVTWSKLTWLLTWNHLVVYKQIYIQ